MAQPLLGPVIPVVGGPPVAAPRRSRPRIPFWLVRPIIGLVIAAAAVIAMVRVLGHDDGTAPATPATTQPSASPAAAVRPAGDQAGTLTVGGTFLLPLVGAVDSAGSLTSRVGQVVQAQAVQVLSTPTTDGAWIGTSEENRVYVRLTGSSPGAVTLATGQRVTFTGTLVRNDDGLAAQVGEGADLLTRLGAHVDAFRGALTAAG